MCATCAYTTIQSAVDGAADGDTIAIAAGTYTEDVEITRSLTLAGAGMGLTVLEGGSMTITGSSDVQVSVTDLTIDGSGAYGGLFVSGITFALTEVEMTDAGPDAGLAIDAGAVATITSCAFTGNTNPSGSGGALYVGEADVRIVDSTFAANSASDGGAIHCAAQASLSVSGSVFAKNRADVGSAISSWISGWPGCTLDIRDTAFTANEGDVIVAEADTVLDDVLMTSNTGYAVQIGNYDADLTVTASTFHRNEVAIAKWRLGAPTGGALTVSESIFSSNDRALEIRCDDENPCGHSEIRGNQFVGNRDAAITVSGAATVGITDSLFAGNTAENGAALYVTEEHSVSYDEYPWPLVVSNNVFCGNRASRDGGALWLGYGRYAEVGNNVFADNSAGLMGGAIHHDNERDARSDYLVNNTLVANQGGWFGGAAYLDWGARWVNDAILYTAAGYGVSGDGWSSSWQYDAWYANVPGDHDFSEALDATHVTADPLLTRWSADGDCSNDDFTLPSGSPAIDVGDPSILDADGTRSDIGACGGPDAGSICTDDDGDGFFAVFDCDDTDPDVHPRAAQACEAVDSDCDGSLGSEDRDRDGWMDCAECEDADPSVYPGAPEVCDGFDDDCDGTVDEDGATWGDTWYADSDGDGWGDDAVTLKACDAPSGYTSRSGDCDDTDAATYPWADEVWYDGVDQDCRGGDDFDRDDDGAVSAEYGGTDCDDYDRSVHPGADDRWYDGVDKNCDGADDFDQDGDGERSDDHGGADCDDLDPAVNPSAEDEPGDGIDSDCDGDDDDDAADTDSPDPVDPKCGCRASPSPAGASVFLVALLARRRRNGRTPRFQQFPTHVGRNSSQS